MPGVPAALLSKLYVKGSLSNTAKGVEFHLKNTLAPSIIVGCLKVEVDGNPHPLDRVFLVKKVSERPATSVNEKTPLPLDINEGIKVILKDLTLAPGHHRILVSVETKEIGKLDIPVEDTL